MLDTCVLYPYYLADTLLTLADAEIYRPLWSVDVLDELRRSLISDASSTATAVDRRIAAMRAGFPAAEVRGYRSMIQSMTNQEQDRHVLAAAVRAGAEVIVTANTKDFAAAALDPYGVAAVHPDEFLLEQLDLHPGVVLECLHRQATGYQHEPRTVGGLAVRLAKAGARDFAAEILRY
jgi:predicted nucleic acid-binding protein